MVSNSPTPLGVLLIAYRAQRGLSQEDLSRRTLALTERDPSVSSVSVRTIRSLEADVADGQGRRPHRDTAHSLAIALELAPGTPAYAAFMAAAGYGASRQPASSPDDAAASREFIEAGREDALRRIGRTIDDAASGTPAALLVCGEAGAGKSAVVDHACRQAVTRHPRAVVLRTTCVDPADRHGPFKVMVRLMLGDPVSVASHRLSPANARRLSARVPLAAAALAENGPLLVATSLADSTTRDRIVDRIADRDIAGRLRALGLAGPTDALRTVPGCEQFVRVLSRYTAAGPSVLVFDDLDRADDATLASLSHLLGRIDHQSHLPIAILCTCLPEGQLDPARAELHETLEDLRRRWPDGILNFDAVTTGAGARQLAEALLASRALPSDTDTVEALLARTDGIPLHMTTLLDTIARDRGSAADRPADFLDRELPADAADALVSRVAALDPELREILVTASVLGDEFLAETAMAMLDIPVHRFIELVDRQLWRRHRLVQEVGTSRVDGQVVHRYRFRPPLLRDALYRSLSDLERTHAHRRAADTLIRLFGDREHEAEERIATHLDRAGRLVEAARAYLRAGDLARASREFVTARRLLERIGTLGVRRDDPETWILSLISLGLVARGTGDIATAGAHFSRALDLATSHQLPLVRARALEALAMLDFHTGTLDRGTERMLAAVEVWAAHDAPDTSRALANLSYLLYGQGHYDQAIASAERARLEATRAGIERSWIDGTIALANCRLDVGQYPAAAELHEHARQAAMELGDLHRQRICRINLSLIAIERGDWDAAARELDRIADAVPPPSEALSAVIALQRGLIAEGRGETAIAANHYRTAHELQRRSGQEALTLDAAAGELRIAVANADRDGTASLLAEIETSIGVRGGIDGVEHPGRLYLALIEAARALGDDASAGDHARAAVAFLTARVTHVHEDDRQGYLWEVASHRRILELAADLGVVTG